MSHAAVKQGGIFFSNKKIAFACFVRDAVNVPFHKFNNTGIRQKLLHFCGEVREKLPIIYLLSTD
jgi:hypothetical protein